jgi:exopolyphosphatase / guanosine-5'-triphosphate,3'-diphosphate pyrophosphatase
MVCRRSAEVVMRIASLDIGTNTILMLIADVLPDGSMKVIRDEHTIARLGRGVDTSGRIQPETFERCRAIIHHLLLIAQETNVQHIYACGTSALRDALNKAEFIEYIRKTTHVTIEVIPGEVEARLSFQGTIFDRIQDNASAEIAVLDIGGGSTELITGSGLHVTSATSMDMGSVRLTERFLATHPPSDISLINAIEYIHATLRTLTPLEPSAQLLGVAGTVTTLAAIEMQLVEFSAVDIDNYILTMSVIERILNKLKSLDLKQIHAIPQIHPLRADIILAGVLILKECMTALKKTEIRVSTKGLRYGLLLEKAKKLR